MLTDDQHKLIRRKLMDLNDAAEWKREETWEGVKNRLKDMTGKAEELARVGKDISGQIEKEG